jgi:hypothetical protein
MIGESWLNDISAGDGLLVLSDQELSYKRVSYLYGRLKLRMEVRDYCKYVERNNKQT